MGYEFETFEQKAARKAVEDEAEKQKLARQQAKDDADFQKWEARNKKLERDLQNVVPKHNSSVTSILSSLSGALNPSGSPSSIESENYGSEHRWNLKDEKGRTQCSISLDVRGQEEIFDPKFHFYVDFNNVAPEDQMKVMNYLHRATGIKVSPEPPPSEQDPQTQR